MADMYEFFAAAYRHNPDISRLFQKTAAEERNHEYQIRLAMRTCTPSIQEMKITAEDVEKHLSFVRMTLQQVRETVPGIVDALKMSIHCETIFSQFHLDTAARFSDESCTRLFKAMMAADEGHSSSLEKALAEFQKG
jgi:rubrerythrin